MKTTVTAAAIVLLIAPVPVRAALLFSGSGNNLIVKFTSPVTWTLDATSTSNPQNSVVWIPGLWSAPQNLYSTGTIPAFQIDVGGVGTTSEGTAGVVNSGSANLQGLMILGSNLHTANATNGATVTIPAQAFTIPNFLSFGSLPDQLDTTTIHLLDEGPFTILGSTSGTVSLIPEPTTCGLALAAVVFLVVATRRSSFFFDFF